MDKDIIRRNLWLSGGALIALVIAMLAPQLDDKIRSAVITGALTFVMGLWLRSGRGPADKDPPAGLGGPGLSALPVIALLMLASCYDHGAPEGISWTRLRLPSSSIPTAASAQGGHDAQWTPINITQANFLPQVSSSIACASGEACIGADNSSGRLLFGDTAGNYLKSGDARDFRSLASAPSGAAAGDVYYDTALGTYRFYSSGSFGPLPVSAGGTGASGSSVGPYYVLGNMTGSSGPAGYAALIASAIPNLPGGIITSGTVGISYLPTGATGSTVPLGNDVRFNAAPSTAGGLPYDTGSAWAETAAGTVHQLLHGASGAPTWSAVALTSEVSGVLPVANGGTNSSTSLNNNRLMCSSGGAIVECSALTNGQIYIGSTGNAPQAATLTAGTNVTITNTAGGITIAASGGPTLPLSQANGGFGQDVSSGNTAGTSVTATASVADGSSAVDFKWNNNVAQSNASAELVEWDNNGTRKAAILAGGGAIHPSIGPDAADQHTIPSGTDAVCTISSTQTLTNKSIAASEVNSGQLAIAQIPTGNTSSTVTVGNDSRLPPTPSSAGGMYYDTASAIAELAAGTTSQVLIGGTTPSFGSVPTAALPSSVVQTGSLWWSGAKVAQYGATAQSSLGSNYSIALEFYVTQAAHLTGANLYLPAGANGQSYKVSLWQVSNSTRLQYATFTAATGANSVSITSTALSPYYLYYLAYYSGSSNPSYVVSAQPGLPAGAAMGPYIYAQSSAVYVSGDNIPTTGNTGWAASIEPVFTIP